MLKLLLLNHYIKEKADLTKIVIDQLWKSKTRVTSSNLRVTSSNLRVARLKARIGRLKARVERLKAQVRRLKARAESMTSWDSKYASWKRKFRVQNIEFHELQKLYFYCLASVELKPHTNVLKNLFHNMAFKNLYVNPKLPTYFSIGHKVRTY